MDEWGTEDFPVVFCVKTPSRLLLNLTFVDTFVQETSVQCQFVAQEIFAFKLSL